MNKLPVPYLSQEKVGVLLHVNRLSSVLFSQKRNQFILSDILRIFRDGALRIKKQSNMAQSISQGALSITELLIKRKTGN